MGINFNPTQFQRPLALPSTTALPGANALAGMPAPVSTSAVTPLATPGADSRLQLLSILGGVVGIMSSLMGTAGAPGAGNVSPFTNSLPQQPTAGQVPGAGTLADGTGPANVFNANDYANFLLAGSKGGAQGTAESIEAKYADQNSRFAQSDPDAFKAAVAGMYSNQFKAYALGLDAAFEPGKDINQLSNNLVQAGNTQMTPEAELLSKVAAVYRGTGSLYNNGALQQLLLKWGRADIANQPNVGNEFGDVQSIGGVVKALNEEKDPAIRQAWLQDIFDFDNNSPTAPSGSGAVPDVANYQFAINYVKSGQLNALLNRYQGLA